MQARPIVISLLTWNQRQLLEDCLESLLPECQRDDVRICVFNQASIDGSREYLERQSQDPRWGGRLDVVHHPSNIGFVLGNNAVFQRYPTRDVVLLNDDTVLFEGWLQALVDAAYSAEDVGAVGSRLIYPNGVLQEAGAEVYQDASGRNIGKFDAPTRAEYDKRRTVDYCSGASLYLRRDALDRVGGGFDERFAPAYYEDTDLCFSMRAAGFRVLYEPRSVLVHREGATNGVDTRQGVKRWQAVNKGRFLEKWGEVLRAKHRRGSFDLRSERPLVLVISQFPPLFDQASGDLRLYRALELLQRSHQVVFLAVDAVGRERYVAELEALGIIVFANDVDRWPAFDIPRPRPEERYPLDLARLLQENSWQLVLCEFHFVAQIYLPLLRALIPEVPVVTDSVDIHFLREEREVALMPDRKLSARLDRNRRGELSAYGRSDLTLVVTPEDGEALRAADPELRVQLLSNVHPIDPSPVPRAARQGLLFIGGYSHRPNVDAVRYMVEEVLPLLHPKHPELTLTLIGSNPPPAILAFASERVKVMGWVADTRPYLDEALISVAPLRYGAGMKGKVGEALAVGLPVVTSSIGAEGMQLVDGVHALIADDATAFAAAIERLLSDDALWERLSAAGPAHVDALYGPTAVAAQWQTILATSTRRSSAERRYFERLPCHRFAGGQRLETVELVIYAEDQLHLAQSFGRFERSVPSGTTISVATPRECEAVSAWCEAQRIPYLCLDKHNERRSWGEILAYVHSARVVLLSQWAVPYHSGIELLLSTLERDHAAIAAAPTIVPAISAELVDAFQIRAHRHLRENPGHRRARALPRWLALDLVRLEVHAGKKGLARTFYALQSRPKALIELPGVLFADAQARPTAPTQRPSSRPKDRALSVVIPFRQADTGRLAALRAVYLKAFAELDAPAELLLLARDGGCELSFDDEGQTRVLQAPQGSLAAALEGLPSIARGELLLLADPSLRPKRLSLLFHLKLLASEAEESVLLGLVESPHGRSWQPPPGEPVHPPLSYLLCPAVTMRSEALAALGPLAPLESDALVLQSTIRRLSTEAPICALPNQADFQQPLLDYRLAELSQLGNDLQELVHFDSFYRSEDLARIALQFGTMPESLLEACLDLIGADSVTTVSAAMPSVGGQSLGAACFQLYANAKLAAPLLPKVLEIGPAALEAMLRYDYREPASWAQRGEATAKLLRAIQAADAKRHAEAIVLAQQARELAPQAPCAAFVLGKLLFDSQEIEAAEEHLVAALELFMQRMLAGPIPFGNPLLTALYLAQSYQLLRRPEPLQALCERVLREFPLMEPAVRAMFYRALAASAAREGEQERAARYQRYVRWLDPGVPDRPLRPALGAALAPPPKSAAKLAGGTNANAPL